MPSSNLKVEHRDIVYFRWKIWEKVFNNKLFLFVLQEQMHCVLDAMFERKVCDTSFT